MIALSALRHWRWIGVGLIIAALAAYGLRNDGLRAKYKGGLDLLAKEAHSVVLAAREASDNPKVEWSTAAGQIRALGDSNRALKGQIEVQNRAIDEQAREAVRLRAQAAELRKIADKAEAQRKSALKRLSDMSLTPGTRSDCLTLLREAEDALDLVREAGA